jgi:histidinol-phosphate aminotransferase
VAVTVEPRPGILGITPYKGGEFAVPGKRRVIRLASNECPLGPSPQAVEAYRREAAELHRYPDGGVAALRTALAAHHGLDPERIVCGNGSDELLSLLAQAYAGPGDEVLYSEHGFLMYPIAARAVDATPVAAPERHLTADPEALLDRVTERTRVLFLANPNNPTGSYLGAETVAELRARLPERVLLVLDAAYAEYVGRNDYDAGQALVRSHDNVVMVRTFSKIYGLAGLRLGWAYCPPAVADVLNRVRGPFNVTRPAQAAGVAALADAAHVAAARALNDRMLPWFVAETRKLGLDPRPSVGNFVLLRFPASTARTAPRADEVLKSHGILTRRMEGYGLPDALRVTIGTEDDMQAVLGALTEYMA